MNGILLIDKPLGVTSHDVIFRLRKILKIKRIGHTGTLDPAASGLLVVLVGTATKLAPYLTDTDKEYRGEILIGKATDTEDGAGKIIAAKPVELRLDIDGCLKTFFGKQKQTPPMYSAVKQQGKKLYELARQGIEVERKPRPITVYCLRRVSPVIYENQTARFSFTAAVSKGTYIRTLAVEIGKRLGYPAHLAALHRTAVGVFSVDSAYSLADVAAGNYRMENMVAAFKKEGIFEVGAAIAKKIKNGQAIPSAELATDSDKIVLAYEGRLLAVYKKKNERYFAERVWN